ncbi:MAG: carotenoid oxygenase family protein, partial [Xenococcaceae cyanobacterium]
MGISRASFNKLGARNQLNTAFVSFRGVKDLCDRLLVTWDAGRPYEIDPETLATLTPVGKNQDWQPLFLEQPLTPFIPILTSAHPCFDPDTNQLFTVNIGKSVLRVLGLSRSLLQRFAENATSLDIPQKSSLSSPHILRGLFYFYSGLFKSLQSLDKILQNFTVNIWSDLLENATSLKIPRKSSSFSPDIRRSLLHLYSNLLEILQWLVQMIEWVEKVSQRFAKHNFVHLLCWDGDKVDIQKKWKVLLSGNRPLIIDQTTHQMGLTRDYLVMAETSFKFSVEKSFPYLSNFLVNDAKIFLAGFLNYTQYPYTKLYIIKRADLEKAETKKNIFSNNLPTVIAQEVTLEPEFSHFLVDYDNPDGKITLHAGHLAASDIGETIRVFDRSAFDDRDRDREDKYDDPELSTRLQKLAGNLVGAMDVNRLGCWVIDGESGELITHHLVDDPQLTWSTSFYVYKDDCPTKKFTNIYWNSWGCWPDTLTIRTVEAYKDYPHRKIPLDRVLELTYNGVPSSLCHLKIDREEKEKKEKLDLNIVDSYQFPRGYLGTSAQFVPR